MKTEKETEKLNNLVGAMYHGPDGVTICALCNCEMEWEECGVCAGDGVEDGHEDDPLNYSPGELINCRYCDGECGSWWCITRDCPTSEGVKTIPAPTPPNTQTEP